MGYMHREVKYVRDLLKDFPVTVQLVRAPGFYFLNDPRDNVVVKVKNIFEPFGQDFADRFNECLSQFENVIPEAYIVRLSRNKLRKFLDEKDPV